MKILVMVIIIFFLLSSHPISAQVNNALIDDFFHSLPTKVYYWRIEETRHESGVLKGGGHGLSDPCFFSFLVIGNKLNIPVPF
jgi:hypothetical protein